MRFEPVRPAEGLSLEVIAEIYEFCGSLFNDINIAACARVKLGANAGFADSVWSFGSSGVRHIKIVLANIGLSSHAPLIAQARPVDILFGTTWHGNRVDRGGAVWSAMRGQTTAAEALCGDFG